MAAPSQQVPALTLCDMLLEVVRRQFIQPLLELGSLGRFHLWRWRLMGRSNATVTGVSGKPGSAWGLPRVLPLRGSWDRKLQQPAPRQPPSPFKTQPNTKLTDPRAVPPLPQSLPLLES